MSFYSLDDNLLQYVAKYFDDKNLVSFLTINQLTYQQKMHVYFHDLYDYHKIKHLSYYSRFKQIKYLASNTNIPDGITHLEFGSKFNEPINACIPKTVVYLKFGNDFNHPIDGCIRARMHAANSAACIPDSVKYLDLGISFNHPIKDCLPDDLILLDMSWDFNQPINGYLPNKLKYLIFRHEFDYYDGLCLPKSITHLTLGAHYHTDKNFRIPESVTHLEFDNDFDEPITNIVPKNVKHLVLGYEYSNSSSINPKTDIPCTVKCLTMSNWLFEAYINDFNDIHLRIYKYFPTKYFTDYFAEDVDPDKDPHMCTEETDCRSCQKIRNNIFKWSFC